MTTRFPASPSISFLSSFGRQSSGSSLPPASLPRSPFLRSDLFPPLLLHFAPPHPHLGEPREGRPLAAPLGGLLAVFVGDHVSLLDRPPRSLGRSFCFFFRRRFSFSSFARSFVALLRLRGVKPRRRRHRVDRRTDGWSERATDGPTGGRATPSPPLGPTQPAHSRYSGRSPDSQGRCSSTPTPRTRPSEENRSRKNNNGKC